MEITGRISKVLPLQQGTSTRGPWSKATIVIEYQSGNYTNILALENMGKVEEFAALPVGAEFKFWFDVTSREYQGKYYTQCTCFNWQAADASQPQTQSPAPASSPAAPQAAAAPQTAGSEDLPY